MPFVDPPIASSTRNAFSNALPVRILSGVRPCLTICTTVAPVSSAMRMRSAVTAGGDAPPGSMMPSASATHAMVLAVPITEQVPTLATSWSFTLHDFVGIDLLCPIPGPEAAAIGARTDAFRAVRSREHRAGHQRNGRHAGGSGAHQLRGHRLVAAADEHHGVHRLRTDHLLGVHRHQVAHVHARRLGEALVDRDGREFHRQSACKHDAALHRLDELVGVAVARVIGAAGVGDSDHEAVQRIVGVPGALDEGLAQEDGKAEVAVAGQALVHALRRLRFGLVGLAIAHPGPPGAVTVRGNFPREVRGTLINRRSRRRR